MKKNYVQPTVEVVTFAPELMLAGSNETDFGGDNQGGFDTKKFQGGWNQQQWNTEN